MLHYLHGPFILCGLKLLIHKVTVICFSNRPKTSLIFVVAWISRLVNFKKTRWICHSCGPVILLADSARSTVDNFDACIWLIVIYPFICEHLSEYRFLRWEVQGIHLRNICYSLDEDVFLIAKLALSRFWGASMKQMVWEEQMTISQCTITMYKAPTWPYG